MDSTIYYIFIITALALTTDNRCSREPPSLKVFKRDPKNNQTWVPSLEFSNLIHMNIGKRKLESLILGYVVVDNVPNSAVIPTPTPASHKNPDLILMKVLDVGGEDKLINIKEQSKLAKLAGYSALIFEDLRGDWDIHKKVEGTNGYDWNTDHGLSDTDIFTCIVPSSVGQELRKEFLLVDYPYLAKSYIIRLQSYQYSTKWKAILFCYGLALIALVVLRLYGGCRLPENFDLCDYLLDILRDDIIKIIRLKHMIIIGARVPLRYRGTGIPDRETCIICFEDFKSEDMVRVFSCSHVFHRGCMNLWIMKSSITALDADCLICKSPIQQIPRHGFPMEEIKDKIIEVLLTMSVVVTIVTYLSFICYVIYYLLMEFVLGSPLLHLITDKFPSVEYILNLIYYVFEQFYEYILLFCYFD